jgi:NAD(P)H-dependent flavin oxidoreductase YrpB (nitropropane dioxygenase family)
MDTGSVMMGQIAGLVDEVKPVKEILSGMMQESQKGLESLQALAGELSC